MRALGGPALTYRDTGQGTKTRGWPFLSLPRVGPFQFEIALEHSSQCRGCGWFTLFRR